MEIRDCDVQQAAQFYNANIRAPYLPLDDNIAKKALFSNGCVTLGAYREGRLIGMCSGNTDTKGRAYLTYIEIEGDRLDFDIAQQLVKKTEAELLGDKDSISIECHYKNPSWLPWRIKNDSHPYAPGVNESTAQILKQLGYEDSGIQNAYYRRLDDFYVPDEILSLEKKLEGEGVAVTLYDKNKHHGLEDLLCKLGNDFWSDYVTSHLDRPILVAVDTEIGRVVSYTGPLRTQESGRGDYCGIGVLNSYRGRGIGKLVFYKMCQYHKEHGASFMSLYTESDNGARFIYEGAGFELVYKWKNLRKVVKRV